jgi:hypothetical protein
VDDFLVTASAKVAKAVTDCVGKQWKCSPAQVLSQKEFIEFTGMRISRINEGIMVSQEHYSQTLLKRVGMSEAVGSNIVMDSEECNDPEVTLQIEAGSWVPELATVRSAQKAVGELNWLSTRTRPDIAYAVQRAASFALRDPDRALRITRRIHKYLITTTGYGLIYRSAAALKHAAEEDGSSPLRQHYDTSALIGYSDASFAPQGSSSQQAFVVMLGGAAILWKTGRQKIVAQSTAEAELLAELDCYLALSGIAAMLQDMTPSPIHTLLAVDNQAAVQLTGGTTTSVSWRTRHLRVKAAGLVQAVMNQELKVVHVPGEFQVADLGTKNLSSAVLKRLIKLLALGTMTTGATAANLTGGDEEFEEEPFWFWISLCILVLWAFILWFGRRWIVWTPLFDSPEPEPEQEAAQEEQEVWQEIPEVAEEEPQLRQRQQQQQEEQQREQLQQDQLLRERFQREQQQREQRQRSQQQRGQPQGGPQQHQPPQQQPQQPQDVIWISERQHTYHSVANCPRLPGVTPTMKLKCLVCGDLVEQRGLRVVYVTAYGERYHGDSACYGLRNSRTAEPRTGCGLCVVTDPTGNPGSSGSSGRTN